MKSMLYVIAILSSLFMRLLKKFYERGKYGCRIFHGTKTPLYVLKVLKLLLFYLPMLVTLFYVNLFVYNIPIHRKRVRLKCLLNFLPDALFYFNSYFSCEHLLKLFVPNLKALKKSTCWEITKKFP